MPEEDKFRTLFPKLIKVVLYADFIVVVDYPDKPPSDPFMLGWRGTDYFFTYEEIEIDSELRRERAIEDMRSRRTKTGYYFDVVDVVFREEIEYEYE